MLKDYYEIKMYAGPNHPMAHSGDMVLHTWHKSKTSRDIEVAVCRDRLAKGELSRIEVYGFGKLEDIY